MDKESVILVPQTPNANTICDGQLLAIFKGGRVPGIQIRKKENGYYFEIHSDFDFKTYEKQFVPLIMGSALPKVKSFFAEEKPLEEVVKTCSTWFNRESENRYFEIVGDVCSKPKQINGEKHTITILTVTNSVTGKPKLDIYFSHNNLSNETLDTLRKIKIDQRVSVRGIINLYASTGEMQMRGYFIQKLDGKSFFQQKIEEERQIFKKTSQEEHLQEEKKPFFISSDAPLPYTVGLITSQDSQGASDFKAKLNHSFKIITKPVSFATADSIINAIKELNTENDCQCLAIIRGGGNRYDLMPFHEAALAEEIAQSPIPVILGIGHNDDHFLCGEVAALSCMTPTDAAIQLRSSFYKARNEANRPATSETAAADSSVMDNEGIVSQQQDKKLEALTAELEKARQRITELEEENKRLRARTMPPQAPSSLLNRLKKIF